MPLPLVYLGYAAGAALVAGGYLAMPSIGNPRKNNAQVMGEGLAQGAEAIADGVTGVFSSSAEDADRAADNDLADTATDTTCETCPCERTVVISRSVTPHTAQHMIDAQAMGKPSVLTPDRSGASARRGAALRGIPTKPGLDRDEYPPAVFAEGGAGASVRHVPLSDNRSAGATMRNQLRGATEGCKITMTVGP